MSGSRSLHVPGSMTRNGQNMLVGGIKGHVVRSSGSQEPSKASLNSSQLRHVFEQPAALALPV